MRLIRHILFIILFTLLGISFAYAEIFYDSSLNIYNIIENKCFKSSDKGITWIKIASFSTRETDFTISENSDKTIYLFSKTGTSLFLREIGKNGFAFSPPKEILTNYFGDSYSIQAVNGYFHLFYRENGHVNYAISYDKGTLFSSPQTLSGFNSAESWIVNVDKSGINLYFSSGKSLFNVNCPDLSGRFGSPRELYISENRINNIIPFTYPWKPASFEVVWTEQADSLVHKLYYLSTGTLIPRVLFTSNDNIISADAKSLNEYSLITFKEDNIYSKKPLMIRILKSPRDIFLPAFDIMQGINIENYLGSFPIENKLAMFVYTGKDLYMQYVPNLLLDINPYAPQLSILKPEKNTYFKSGATVLISGKIIGNTLNIEDSQNAQIFIDGNGQENSVYYSIEDNNFTGILNLSRSLPEGMHNLIIKLSNKEGILGIAKTQFYIDNTKPKPLNYSIINATRQISIPFDERGSGIDKSSVRINVFSGTREVSGQLKIDNNIISFVPNKELEYGDYVLQYICRDNAGNSTSSESIGINISPSLSNLFSQSTISDSIFISVINGPNPFSPSNGGQTVVKYSLSQPATINLLVYSLQGNIIYRNMISALTTSGEITWDGRDVYNNILEAGIYPYMLQAQDASGNKYLKRGKIIVF